MGFPAVFFGYLTTPRAYGTDVPDLDFTNETSEALITPLAVTSARKLDAVSDCPVSALVWLTSDALTVPLPFVSPTRMLIGMVMSFVLVPLFTPNKVIINVCAFVTPLRFTVRVAVPLPLVLVTIPVPEVTLALLNVTGFRNVTTI